MSTGNEIEKKAESILKRFPGKERLTVDPYFATRVLAGIDEASEKPVLSIGIHRAGVSLRPVLLMAVILVNLLTAAWVIKFQPGSKTTHETLVTQLAEEYAVNTTSMYSLME